MNNNRSFRNPGVIWLTIIVVLFSITASVGGLLIDGLYKDSELIRKSWFANDLVTLIIAPLLIVSLSLQKRGDGRGLLIWLGLMLYMFYNYAFYLFGAKFNEFFLIYVALFSLSLYSIIMGLLSVNVHAIHENSAYHKSKILISLYLFLLAIPIFVVEIKQCLAFIFSGKNPEVPTLIFALDLSTVIPTTIFASILLWKNHPWGNVVGMMVLVKAFTYGLVLVVGTLLVYTSGIGKYDRLFPFYISLVLGGLIFGWIHFKDLKPTNALTKKI